MVTVTRPDGSMDHFYLTPDGTMCHSYELTDHSINPPDRLLGQWCAIVNAFWSGNPSDPVNAAAATLHVRGVGWGGGFQNTTFSGADGSIFEVVWDHVHGFTAPVLYAPAASALESNPVVQGIVDIKKAIAAIPQGPPGPPGVVPTTATVTGTVNLKP